MVEIKSASYEECRAEHFKKLMQKMQRKIDYWQYRGRYSLEHLSMLSRAYHECSEAGIQYNFYNDALTAFENQPKWISVEERLPDIENENGTAKCTETVLGVDKLGYQYVGFFRVYKCDNSFEFVGCDCDGFDRGEFDVTHWMKLPEPPKENE